MVTINSGNVGGDVYGNDVDARSARSAIIRSFCRAARSAATSWAEQQWCRDRQQRRHLRFRFSIRQRLWRYGAAEGTVNGNDVSIFDSGSVTGNVLGGYSRSVNSHVIGNTVTISGGVVYAVGGDDDSLSIGAGGRGVGSSGSGTFTTGTTATP